MMTNLSQQMLLDQLRRDDMLRHAEQARQRSEMRTERTSLFSSLFRRNSAAQHGADETVTVYRWQHQQG